MKRDMDLVRRILFEMERLPEDDAWVDLGLEDVDPKVLSAHVRMMAEAELIEAKDLSSNDGPDWRPTRLTWGGHEFLDLIRSQTVWEKVKKAALEKTGGLALEVLRQCAVAVAKGLMA